MVGKSRTAFFFWVFFLSLASVAIPEGAFAQRSSADAEELEQLLDKEGEDIDVETEEEYALPVPAAAEENSPVLNEADADRASPSDRNQDLFLPVPSDQAGLPAVAGEEDEDFSPFYRAGEMRYENNKAGYNKPAYSIFGGGGVRSYTVAGVEPVRSGFEVGVNLRFLNGTLLKMPLSMHFYGSVSFISINTMYGVSEGRNITVVGVQDTTYRAGLMLELELSRRVQLFGAIYQRQNIVSNEYAHTDTIDPLIGDYTRTRAGPVTGPLLIRQITGGIGAQWDFYVVPYASLGLRGWLEPGYASLTMVFSLEPRPRNRNSLNFEWD